MIHDRGSIKWASLMLPEHVKALREWRETEIHPSETAPLFDEQQKEVLDQLIHTAYTTKSEVKVLYLTAGKRESFSGWIESIYPLQSTFKIVDNSGTKKEIPVSTIIHIDIQS